MPTLTLTAARRHVKPALLLLAALLVLLAAPRLASAAPTSLTYTGQLLTSLSPPTAANGSYDMQFKLFTAATGGGQAGPTISVASVPVVGGIYYAQLNFGNVFSGTTYWLETSYRVAGTSGSYTAVSPRPIAPNSAFADYATLSGSTLALQGKGISATAPTSGQVLTYSGTAWAPATPAVPSSYAAGAGLSLSGTTFSIPNGGVTASMLGAGSVTPSAIALPLNLTGASGSAILQVSNTNTGSGYGLYAISAAPGYAGIRGDNDTTGTTSAGLNGNCGSGYGIYGTSGTGTGVYGSSTSGSGGYFTGGGTDGLYATTTRSGGNGIIGEADAGTNAYGVFGVSTTGLGVVGSGPVEGVAGDSNAGNGVNGSSSTGSGVLGSSANGYGVYGVNGSTGDFGFLGGLESINGDSVPMGVFGYSTNGVGVQGDSENYTGVYGRSVNGNAGYFEGKVVVLDDLHVYGAITAGTKDFRIDDPLDPAGKYLSHASVESDQMEDVYHGHVTTDGAGNASVTMPRWFEALNTDFEYQLTVLGQFAQAVVSSEIQNNRFGIKTDHPNVKVSWQVTGVRHDAFALAHPLQVEEDKPADEQGTYQNPDAFGQPEDMGTGYAQRQAHATSGPRQP